MWKSFSVNSKQYFFHSNYENGLFTVRLTDLITVWEGVLSDEAIREMFKECNSIDGIVDLDKVLNFLETDLSPQNTQVAKTIKAEEGNLHLSLVSLSKDISFNFNLKLASPEDFYKVITLPLMLIVQELNNRQEKLKQILKEKDAEISEYQLEGGKLFRRYLTTNKFDDAVFIRDCAQKTETNLQDSVNSIDKVFGTEVNSIYSSAIKICKNIDEKKITERDDTSAAGEVTGNNTSGIDDQSKGKLRKWELEPQNVKRFKTKRTKITL